MTGLNRVCHCRHRCRTVAPQGPARASAEGSAGQTGKNDPALPATLQPAGERSPQSGSIADGSSSDPGAASLAREAGGAAGKMAFLSTLLPRGRLSEGTGRGWVVRPEERAQARLGIRPAGVDP